MPAFSGRTSGTTGSPKAVDLTADQMAARVARLASTKGEGFAALNSIYCDISPDSTAAARYEQWIKGKGGSFFQPQGTLAATVAQFAANKIEGFIGSPQAAFRFLPAMASYQFEYAVLSGSSPRKLEDWATLKPLAKTIVLSYGASEVGTIALATYEQASSILGCVGTPCADLTVDIVNGQVRVKGDAVLPQFADTYGYYWPGDKARMENGLLILEGRT